MKRKIKTVYMSLLAVMVWIGLGIQFYISTVKYLAEGRTFAGGIVQLLSFFTIEVNILIALALTLILFKPLSRWGRFFSKPPVLTVFAFYITIVGLIYQVILRKQFHLHGLFKFADDIFHIACPILFVLFWLLFVPKTNIKWGKVFTWLIYPLIYFFYILIRGAISSYYPYNFLDALKIGYRQIAVNFVLLLSVFLIIGTIFIAVSRLLKQKPPL